MKRPVGRDEIAAQIRTDIMTGVLMFGQRFSENTYAERFNVSRTPVREAILSLASLGLLEIKPRSGTYVTSFSEASLQQLFDVRLLLESGAVRIASRQQRLKLLTKLEDLYRHMDRNLEASSTFDEFSDFDTQFHSCLVAAADNPQLVKMYQPIEACAQAARSRLDKTSSVWDTAQDHHALVVEAIRDGDMVKFERVLRDHLAWVLGMLLRIDELFDRGPRLRG